MTQRVVKCRDAGAVGAQRHQRAQNFCLVMGIARAGAADQTVLLTGLAGLVTGACSMALGEWLSVTSRSLVGH
jgi:VIT1/CCC1 family predicted Fe2+/Mn2+ transporter